EVRGQLHVRRLHPVAARDAVDAHELGTGLDRLEYQLTHRARAVLLRRVRVDRDLSLALFQPDFVYALGLVPGERVGLAGAGAAQVDADPRLDETLQELAQGVLVELARLRERRCNPAERAEAGHCCLPKERSVKDRMLNWRGRRAAAPVSAEY